MLIRRLSILIFGIGVVGGALAAPAWAHVSVGADPAQSGVANVVEFHAASESTTAGITKLEIVADPAVPADLVTLVEGPSGWKVGAGGSAGGFTLEGPALPVGQDAEVKVRVASLPAAPQIVFKVLESYSDGKVDRWIELAGPDGHEPESPAPILKLGAGVQTAAHEEAEEEHPQTAGETLARTGSESHLLLAVAGLLLIAGGSAISVEAGCRRSPHREGFRSEVIAGSAEVPPQPDPRSRNFQALTNDSPVAGMPVTGSRRGVTRRRDRPGAH